MNTVEKITNIKNKLEKSKNHEKILNYLLSLERIPVDLATLQATKIGKTVNSFRKSEGKIGEKSRLLVNRWKSLVDSNSTLSTPNEPPPKKTKISIDQYRQSQQRDSDELKRKTTKATVKKAPATVEVVRDFDRTTDLLSANLDAIQKQSARDAELRRTQMKHARHYAPKPDVLDDLTATKRARVQQFINETHGDVQPQPASMGSPPPLPKLNPNYRPLRVSPERHVVVAKKEGRSELDDDLFSGRSKQRTMVYSGRRVPGIRGHELPKLFDLCIALLINNIDDLTYVGGVPFDILRPVLEKCSPQQLFSLEDFNPQFLEDTEYLWERHCHRDFKQSKPEEFESWRELHLRRTAEREARFERVKETLTESMAKSDPRRCTKMALVEPQLPRHIRLLTQKRARLLPIANSDAGASSSLDSVHGRSRRFKVDVNEAVIINKPLRSGRGSGGGGGGGGNQADKKPVKSVPPMMMKTLKMMKTLHR